MYNVFGNVQFFWHPYASDRTAVSLDKKAIDEIVSELIAPVIAVDGGSIEVVNVDEDEKRIAVRFGGTYRGSPCQGVVLKHIVEPVLKNQLSSLTSVEMVD